LSLAYRDIRRGQLGKMPSAHTIIEKVKAPPQVLSEQSIWDRIREGLSPSRPDFNPSGKPVPLWLYILFEAQEFGQGGEHLGPLGGQIVSDVIIGLLKRDPESFLSRDSNWTPDQSFVSVRGRPFGIADLIQMAEDQKRRHLP